jgi:glycosyltransferase involved in cell wall biosynthesis
MGSRGVGLAAPVPVLFVEKSIGLSGSTISLCTLLKRLDRRLFEPHVVVSRPEQQAYLKRLVPDVEVILLGPRRWPRNGTTSQPVWRRRLRAIVDTAVATLPYAGALAQLARRRRIALIHQNNGFDEAAVLASRLLHVPLVAYQRGNEWDSRLVRLLAPRVTRYLANSEATRQSLLALGVSPDRVHVVYPPVVLSDFPAARERHVGRVWGSAGESGAGFGIVGQLQRWKGQHVFLQASQLVLGAVPDARAWVVGGAVEGHRAYAFELKRLAQSLGIADRVVFTGFVHDVPAVLALLDVVVHASIAPEPFGRVIVEAMAMGKAVVASDAGGPREIIDEGRTGLLVPPGDHERLAGAVIALLKDRGLAGRLGEAGCRAASRFSPEEHARRIQDVYFEVLDGLGRGAVGASEAGYPGEREVP